MRSIARPGLWFALIVLAAPLGVTRAAPAPSPPRFESEVALVTLPVFVTGQDGQPMTGLTARDFEVTDDGRPATVVSVQEIDALAPLPASAASPAVQASARRQFLLLFDLTFSNPAGIVRARTAAQEFVRASLAPSDLAAVATFSSQGVRVLLGFTTDRRQLVSALDTLGLLHVQRSVDPLSLTYDLAPEFAAPYGEGRGPVQGGGSGEWIEFIREQVAMLRRGQEQQYLQRVGDFLGGLRSLARTLDSVRGRKQIVLLSAGFDQTPLVGSQGQQAERDSQAVITGRVWEVPSDARFGSSSVRSAMEEMAKAFAASDAIVHAVDVNGLAARAELTQAGPEQRWISGREALTAISSLTGGRLIADTNDLAGALRGILDGTRRYYVLALEPAAKGPGRFHRLRVRVPGRAAQVSHRAGYVERTAVADAQAGRMQAAEAIAKGLTGGDLDVGVVAVPYRDAGGRLSLPVVVEVGGQSLLTGAGPDEMPLEIYGYALDAQGSVVDLTVLTPRLTLSKLSERVRQNGLQLQTAFAVKPGAYDLRFVVRDAATGRLGSRRIEVVVPSFDSGSVAVSPPLFMADPAQRVVLQTASRHNAAPEMPFRVDSDLFTPQGLPRLENGRTDSICLLAFSPTPFDAKTSFQLSAYLTDEHGGRAPIGTPLALSKVVAEPDGFRRFVLLVTPRGVPPGEYTLHVRLKDPLAAEPAETAAAVRID